jgi:transcriptional regulator with XRE-family HTH domain
MVAICKVCICRPCISPCRVGYMVPTVRLRRLAADMRRLREEARLTREDVEARTGINAATLYRLEAARVQRPQRRTLMALLDAYGVPEDLRARMLASARDVARPGLLQIFADGDVPEVYNAYVSFEADARSISDYESLIVPGLLQTEEYAHHIVRNLEPETPGEVVERRVRVRMERQALLHKPDPIRLWAIVDEAALHRVVGSPSTMRAQLHHLLKMAYEPRITIQVVPFAAGAYPGMQAPFVILEYPDGEVDPPIVYLDGFSGGQMFLEGEVEIGRHRMYFDHLRAVALSPDGSNGLIDELARALEGR